MGLGSHQYLPLPCRPLSLCLLCDVLAVPAPWLGCAPSPCCFVRVSLSWLCSSCHLQVLSSLLAPTPDLLTGAACLPPASFLLLIAAFFQGGSFHCFYFHLAKASVPVSAVSSQAHSPHLFSPSDSFSTLSKESQILCTNERLFLWGRIRVGEVRRGESKGD
jgi:hypothetical protein